VVLRVVWEDGDQVILVMEARSEMSGVLVPLGVEEHLVKHHVCNENNCSLLSARPPWLVMIKAYFLLLKNNLV
jgi:hypothetical protein